MFIILFKNKCIRAGWVTRKQILRRVLLGEGLFRKILESTLLEKKRKMQVGPKEQMECDTGSVTAAGSYRDAQKWKCTSRAVLSESRGCPAFTHYISLEILDL